MKPAKDLTGQRFGRLMVINRIPRKPTDRNAFWLCKCDCGNETIVAGANLGKTSSSCGCLAKETVANLLKGNTNQRTHNLSHTPEYRAWNKIKQRCHNPNNPKYKDYGKRGIYVCRRWFDSFENFLEDMGKRPEYCNSIDRINNDGSYEPGNCRWATHKEQVNNRRTTKKFLYKGELLTISDIIDMSETLIRPKTIITRIYTRGMSAEEAVNTPLERTKT